MLPENLTLHRCTVAPCQRIRRGELTYPSYITAIAWAQAFSEAFSVVAQKHWNQEDVWIFDSIDLTDSTAKLIFDIIFEIFGDI